VANLRAGQPLRIRGEPVRFSFWPMRRGQRRWGLNSMIYAADPWAVIQAALDRRVPDVDAAQSFVRQANQYFRAGSQSSEEAAPLLYYYCFMNLAKALALVRRHSGLVGRARHGLTPTFAGTLQASTIDAFPTTSTDVNVFDELHQCLMGARLASATSFDVSSLMAQCLFGHRLWVVASARRERFIEVDSVEVLHDQANRQLWINLAINAEALRRRGYGVTEVLNLGDLQPDWEAVRGTLDYSGTRMRVFQQATPITYGHRAADDLMNAVEAIRPKLWRSIYSSQPYRTYYVYLSPAGEPRLNQFVTIYALMFVLGYATRYRPTLYLDALQSSFGPFLREFLASQPAQFLYALASEFAQREVSRAAVV
jgi:YaaC-like Protein